jgi:exonuclease III
MHRRRLQNKMSSTQITIIHRPLKITYWNANGVLGDQYLLRKFLTHSGRDTVLLNEIHRKPATKWHVRSYKKHRTEGRRPLRQGTAFVMKSSLFHDQINLPHFAALEATAVNILTRAETFTIGAVLAPPSRLHLADDPTILK